MRFEDLHYMDQVTLTALESTGVAYVEDCNLDEPGIAMKLRAGHVFSGHFKQWPRNGECAIIYATSGVPDGRYRVRIRSFSWVLHTIVAHPGVPNVQRPPD